MEKQQINILAVGRHEEIMQVVDRLLNAQPAWFGTAVTNDADAIAALEQKQYDIVLLCSGIAPGEEAALKESLLQKQPSLLFIQHYGGGSGLLQNEILAALDRAGIRLVPGAGE